MYLILVGEMSGNINDIVTIKSKKAMAQDFFRKNSQDTAICLICEKAGTKVQISCKSSSTSNMNKHASIQHPTEWKKASDKRNTAPVLKSNTIQASFKTGIKYKLNSQVFIKFLLI